ncbi:hypothetical protein, partial [Cronobacter sakazakii]|uniref:hypothetical protein n=1 Tax=Cronobacter sakazakii TaxID=28141 RepID=UPI0021168DDA
MYYSDNPIFKRSGAIAWRSASLCGFVERYGVQTKKPERGLWLFREGVSGVFAFRQGLQQIFR